MPVLETKTGLYMTCNLTLFFNVISIIVFVVYASYFYVALTKMSEKKFKDLKKEIHIFFWLMVSESWFQNTAA